MANFVGKLKALGPRLPLAYKVFLATRQRVRGAYRLGIQLALPYLEVPELTPNHGLPGELVVSVTSYRPRFETLHLTLISILRQSVSPDRVILWLAYEDFPYLPEPVRKLEKAGLEIRQCEDLRSYKKVIPCLKLFPEAYIVTADDDIYYSKTWLFELVNSYLLRRADVICHRAHKVSLDTMGEPRPYKCWEWNVGTEMESSLLMPTSGAGALYEPGALDEHVTDKATFLALCPTADDLWLYWMARLNGSSIRVLGGRRSLITWEGTQDKSLVKDNLGAKSLNDLAIRSLMDCYGFPAAGG